MGFEHRVSAEDDDLHEVREDVELWSESALIVCHDPATGLSVYGHLVLLETQVWEAIFSVYLPNGEILTDRSYSRHDPVARRTGQMVIKPIVPLETWQFGFDGMARRVLMSDLARGPLGGGPVTRLEVDLRCEGTSPTWGRGMRTEPATMSHDDKNPAVSGSGLHLEQSIRVTGTVRFDRHTIELNAVGHRDHSCGPRARSNQWRVAWAERVVSERPNVPRAQRVGGRPAHVRARLRLGRVGDGGPAGLRRPGAVSVRWASRGTSARASAPPPGSSPGRAVARQHAHHRLHAPGGDGRAELAGDVAVDGPARWIWDGEVGYGWAQRTWIRGGWDEVRESDRRSVYVNRSA